MKSLQQQEAKNHRIVSIANYIHLRFDLVANNLGHGFSNWQMYLVFCAVL